MKRYRLVPQTFLLVAVCLTNLTAQKPEDVALITVTGRLIQVVATGAETTGWAIKLDSEGQFSGRRVKLLEVSGDRGALARLKNRHVDATGTIITHHGVERGAWPVLEIASIVELSRAH